MNQNSSPKRKHLLGEIQKKRGAPDRRHKTWIFREIREWFVFGITFLSKPVMIWL